MQAIQKLDIDRINRLVDESGRGAHVTIYLPTHKAASPPHMTEDQIRCKNLMRAASSTLRDNNQSQLADFLDRKHAEMLEDKSFWEHQLYGLLICARQDDMQLFYLPIDTEEYVSIDSVYHLAPVFGLLHDAHDYYVLAVSQHQPRLLKGNMYELVDAGIKMPDNLETALQIDEMNQKSEQQRSAKGANGNIGGSFNGRGGAKNPAEAERQRYWRILDELIREQVDTSLPLVLAGVESETVEFRNVSNWPKLLDGTITGNHSSDNPNELFDEAKAIVSRELDEQDHEQAVEHFEMLQGANAARTADTFDAIEDAASQGRVDTLLVGTVRHTTDTVRDNNNEVPVLSFMEDARQNRLLHEVAMEVWKTSGQVINLEQDSPELGHKPALAALRY